MGNNRFSSVLLPKQTLPLEMASRQSDKKVFYFATSFLSQVACDWLTEENLTSFSRDISAILEVLYECND